MQSNFENAYQRIINIGDVNHSENIEDVNFYLIRNYFKQIVNTNKTLHEKKINSVFRLSEVFSTDISPEYQEKIDKVRKILSGREYDACTIMILVDYLKWNYYLDQGDNIAVTHRDIHESLIKIIENGYVVGRNHHGEIMVGNFSIGTLSSVLKIASEESENNDCQSV
ncbi:hypothetical protein XL92_004103 [Salmonella enterica subsp. enterica]|nr:hypothetical protein [Salmonella enterica subsp. enterica]